MATHIQPFSGLLDVNLIITAKRYNQEIETSKKHKGLDYPTYTLNSTSGKVIRALFDYSLIKTRVKRIVNEDFLWEKDVNELFDKTLNEGNN
jgi:hypothetical protein